MNKLSSQHIARTNTTSQVAVKPVDEDFAFSCWNVISGVLLAVLAIFE